MLNSNSSRLISVLVLILIFSSAAMGSSITVGKIGCDYTNIWEAIDAANPGDIIDVQSGTYYENIIVDKKLTLRGLNTGTGLPIVDASGRRDAITLRADDITLDGFVAINSGNDFSNDAGIKVISNNSIILNNSVIGNNANGIRLVKSSNCIITNNTAKNNKYNNIQLEESHNNKISANTAIDSGYSTGIMLYFSDNNIVFGNTATGNNRYGIHAQFSKNNRIYLNNLVDNKDSNAYEYPYPNLWYDGKIGNLYSDFDEPGEGCKDKNSDNICDFEYQISGSSSIDLYPIASWKPLSNMQDFSPTLIIEPLATAAKPSQIAKNSEISTPTLTSKLESTIIKMPTNNTTDNTSLNQIMSDSSSYSNRCDQVVHVKGYTTKKGKYVAPYDRRPPGC
jgi:parallel beta-helix repeat protein